MSGIQRLGSLVRGLGLLLAIVGYFGPWVPHRTAALTVTGFELAEFAKFFPQVQGGTVPVVRELFYLPLLTVCILLTLFAGRSAIRLVRWGAPLFFVSLLVAALLPYSIVDAARQALTASARFTVDPQYAGQLVFVVVGIPIVLLTTVASRCSRRVQNILVACLALVGVIPALWQFALIHPLVVALYNAPVGLGWGLVACVLGFALLFLSAPTASNRRLALG